MLTVECADYQHKPSFSPQSRRVSRIFYFADSHLGTLSVIREFLSCQELRTVNLCEAGFCLLGEQRIFYIISFCLFR
jgi:hypothetical protein